VAGELVLAVVYKIAVDTEAKPWRLNCFSGSVLYDLTGNGSVALQVE
jgi:hypothetical protein